MGGVKVTVTLNEELYKAARKIQGLFISNTLEDWSFTTILNLLVLAGIMAPSYISKDKEEEFWRILQSFIKGERENLELEGMMDKLLTSLINKINKLVSKSRTMRESPKGILL